jgi:hypothetical protein
MCTAGLSLPNGEQMPPGTSQLPVFGFAYHPHSHWQAYTDAAVVAGADAVTLLVAGAELLVMTQRPKAPQSAGQLTRPERCRAPGGCGDTAK